METPRHEVLTLWGSLPAPSHDALAGEFVGLVHHGGDVEARMAKEAFFFGSRSPYGVWLGKGFRATDDVRGEGYNRYAQPDSSVERILRFTTFVGPSDIDGRPSYFLRYGSFDHDAARIDLIDEVRTVGVGAFLGIYHANRTVPGFLPVKQEGAARTELEIFGLLGPEGPWVGPSNPHAEPPVE